MWDLQGNGLVAKKADGSPERKTLAVKLDSRIVKQAKAIADDRGINVSDYLSDLVRDHVARDWKKILKRMAEEEEEESG